VEFLVTKNNQFKIFFKDSKNNIIDLDYYLYDSEVAQKWFKKIKHLSNVPIDPIESELVNLTDLSKIYKEFCEFANLQPINVDEINQDKLNQLHKIYEQSHDQLSRKKDSEILYRFHHSIHFHEGTHESNSINIGWGVKEGPLTEKFYCNSYYENNIIKNNIYLPWTELGKKPLDYWRDKEPNDHARFIELAKPHITLRATFSIAKKTVFPVELDKNFIEWFTAYKQPWLEHHNIKKWDSIDENSAPLLAVADHTEDINPLRFHKILRNGN